MSPSIDAAVPVAPSRARLHGLSRAIIVLLCLGATGSLLWTPDHLGFTVVDVLLRAYLMFLGTVMAHEGVHGHLGRSRAANLWWGRIALVPVMVPFTNFRKTHMMHHAFTNDPERDPDIFIKPGRGWELPIRALLMPHQWFFWLRARGRVHRDDIVELVLNYVGIFAVYAGVAAFAGIERVLMGVLPALFVVSMVLWIPFALKTHEGWSLGDDVERSHDYYGRGAYWLTLGLSMHRAHHMYPKRAWLELLPFVKPSPARGLARLLPRRDVRLEPAAR